MICVGSANPNIIGRPAIYNGNVSWLPFLAVFATALFVALIFGRWAVKLGLRLGIADLPGGRRTHPVATSRLGALPIFAGFVAGAALTVALSLPSNDAVNERVRLQGMMLGTVLMFATGIADDRWQLSARVQLVAQLLAAALGIAHLIFIERFRNPFGAGEEVILMPVLYVLVSILWHVGMMNTVNFVDGVDSLTGTLCLIASLFLAAHMLRESQDSVALLPVALAGALLGFLAFNRPQARLFMGGGAPMLGFILSCLSIMAGAKLAAVLLVMGLPIADVALQIVGRLRRGQSPFSADRGHLHLRLRDHGWSAARITSLYASFCILFGSIALLPVSAFAKLVALVIVLVAAIVLLRRFT